MKYLVLAGILVVQSVPQDHSPPVHAFKPGGVVIEAPPGFDGLTPVHRHCFVVPGDLMQCLNEADREMYEIKSRAK